MNGLDLLVPREMQRDTWVWATVTDDSPLRIRLDGEDDPLPFTPDTLAGPLAIGDRVWVVLFTNSDPSFRARRAVIVGTSGGFQDLLADLAADIATNTAAISNLLTASWSAYTPVWTSDGTQPAIVNGTITGHSRKPTGSNLVDTRIKFTRGSSDTNGTGSYFFSTPQGAASEVGTAVGTWYLVDASPGQHYSGTAILFTATTLLLVRDTGTVIAGNPVDLATNDIVSIRASYQPV